MKKNLLIISDGIGVDNNFKKWPFYLQLLLLKTHRIINRSVVGASNELIFMQLAESIALNQIDQAIIQWTSPQRVDVIADDFWVGQAAADPVYHFNLITSNNQTWWVTSASKNEHIRKYHDTFINPWQAKQRSQSYMIAAAELCKSNNIDFTFSLCYKFEFEPPLKDQLDRYPWALHQPAHGISEFRHYSQHSSYDTGLAQPHSLIHLDWINKVLMPQCAFIDYDQKIFYNIEQALLKQCSE